MNLTFKIFGFEIATLDLVIPEAEPNRAAPTVVEKAVGGMSQWWTKRMFSR